MQLALFEGSTTVHSIIIGFNLGQLGDNDIGTINALMIALAFHQFFEGWALGTMLGDLRVSNTFDCICGLLFALTTPVGIVLGICTTSSATGDIVKGCSNGVAAGFLIYSGLVDILLKEFQRKEGQYPDKDVPVMCLSTLLGAAAMGLLAVWA